jgi:hypothetical protein
VAVVIDHFEGAAVVRDCLLCLGNEVRREVGLFREEARGSPGASPLTDLDLGGGGYAAVGIAEVAAGQIVDAFDLAQGGIAALENGAGVGVGASADELGLCAGDSVGEKPDGHKASDAARWCLQAVLPADVK